MNSTSSIDPAFAKAPSSANASGGRSALQPWQFYMTASFLAAAAAVWLSPPAAPVALIFTSLAIFAAGACATALHAMLAALSGGAVAGPVAAESERAALEREKLLALRAIKDLQFDVAMKKVSPADAAPMEARLRERAAAIMLDLDAREHVRAKVERDIAARKATPRGPEARDQRPEARPCGACGTPNDGDARFCKACGAKL